MRSTKKIRKTRKTKTTKDPFILHCPNWLNNTSAADACVRCRWVSNTGGLVNKRPMRFTHANVFPPDTNLFPPGRTPKTQSRIAYLLRAAGQQIYSGLSSYGTTFSFNRTLKDKHDFAVGLELEVDLFSTLHKSRLTRDPPLSPSRYIAASSDVLLSNWFFAKRDSSLNDDTGIELVTIPLGSDFCFNLRLWQGFFAYVRALSSMDYDDSYGQHLHVNTNFFVPRVFNKGCLFSSSTPYKAAAAALVSKIYHDLQNERADAIDLLFGRTPNSYCYEPDINTAYDFNSLLTKDSLPTFEEDSFPGLLLEYNAFLMSEYPHIYAGLSASRKEQRLRNVAPLLSQFRSLGLPLKEAKTALFIATLKFDTPMSDSRFATSWEQRCVDNGLQEIVWNGRNRHTCVNVSSFDTTIEFRQGVSTLDEAEFVVRLYFIYALCSYVRKLLFNPPKDMNKPDSLLRGFLNYAYNHSPHPLIRYLFNPSQSPHVRDARSDPSLWGAFMPRPSVNKFLLDPWNKGHIN